MFMTFNYQLTSNFELLEVNGSLDINPLYWANKLEDDRWLH